MLNASLIDRLRSALPSWKNARLERLGYLIVSIVRNRTVNLAKRSAEASGDLKDESLYRRFQNFFLHFAMPFDEIARLVVAKLSKPEGGWVLSMDRTNWKYGRTHLTYVGPPEDRKTLRGTHPDIHVQLWMGLRDEVKDEADRQAKKEEHLPPQTRPDFADLRQ